MATEGQASDQARAPQTLAQLVVILVKGTISSFIKRLPLMVALIALTTFGYTFLLLYVSQVAGPGVSGFLSYILVIGRQTVAGMFLWALVGFIATVALQKARKRQLGAAVSSVFRVPSAMTHSRRQCGQLGAPILALGCGVALLLSALVAGNPVIILGLVIVTLGALVSPQNSILPLALRLGWSDIHRSSHHPERRSQLFPARSAAIFSGISLGFLFVIVIALVLNVNNIWLLVLLGAVLVGVAATLLFSKRGRGVEPGTLSLSLVALLVFTALLLASVGIAAAASGDTSSNIVFGTPQYLIHATGHGTYDGPVKDDWWFLYHTAPTNNRLELPDGMGGTFTYTTDYSSGPYKDSNAVIAAAPAAVRGQTLGEWNGVKTFVVGPASQPSGTASTGVTQAIAQGATAGVPLAAGVSLALSGPNGLVLGSPLSGGEGPPPTGQAASEPPSKDIQALLNYGLAEEDPKNPGKYRTTSRYEDWNNNPNIAPEIRAVELYPDSNGYIHPVVVVDPDSQPALPDSQPAQPDSQPAQPDSQPAQPDSKTPQPDKKEPAKPTKTDSPPFELTPEIKQRITKDMQEQIDDNVSNNYAVANPNTGWGPLVDVPIKVWRTGRWSFDFHAHNFGTCQNFAEWGGNWTPRVVAVRGATYDALKITNANWPMVFNHIANRVTLPNGKRLIVDWWESQQTGRPRICNEADWIKKWTKEVGADGSKVRLQSYDTSGGQLYVKPNPYFETTN